METRDIHNKDYTKKDNLYFEVVRETLDDSGDVDDFNPIDSFFDYDSALECARKQKPKKNEQIAIWVSECDTLNVINSQVIVTNDNGEIIYID